MGIRFQCLDCQHRLNVKTFLAGKRGKCPSCGTTFRIPWSDQEYADPLRAEPEPSCDEPEHVHAATAAQEAALDESPVERDSHTATASADQAASELSKTNGSQHEISPAAAGQDVIWYVRPPSGGQYGPAGTALMQQWIKENRVVAGSLVWRDGWAQWRTAEEAFGSELDQPAFEEVDLEEDLPQVAGRPSDSGGTAIGTGRLETEAKRSNTEIEQRLQARRRKRTKMIAMLTGISLFLVVVIIIVVINKGGQAG